MRSERTAALLGAVRMVERADLVLESFVLHGHGFPAHSRKCVERLTLVEQVRGLLIWGATQIQMTDARLDSCCASGAE